MAQRPTTKPTKPGEEAQTQRTCLGDKSDVLVTCFFLIFFSSLDGPLELDPEGLTTALAIGSEQHVYQGHLLIALALSFHCCFITPHFILAASFSLALTRTIRHLLFVFFAVDFSFLLKIIHRMQIDMQGRVESLSCKFEANVIVIETFWSYLETNTVQGTRVPTKIGARNQCPDRLHLFR